MIYNFCTLFDKNYLTRGLALHDSLLHHCQPFKLWILCMDETTYDILAKLNLDNVALIKLSEFEDKRLLTVKPTRTLGEYCWTCAPSLPLYIFKHLLEVKLISYLDADLYFYSSPKSIFKEFGDNSIMIIPHRFSVNGKRKEKKAGIYNVSMVTFRRDLNGLKCLSWWRKKCLEWCFNRQEDDKLGDQKYLDDFPRLFKKVHVLKNIGANVAPWNIDQYHVLKRNGNVLINDNPLIFYHFLGLKIYKQLYFLPRVSSSGYGDWTNKRRLVYQEYFDKICEMSVMVQKVSLGFNYGFEPRPKNFLKEVFIDGYLRIFSRFHKI